MSLHLMTQLKQCLCVYLANAQLATTLCHIVIGTSLCDGAYFCLSTSMLWEPSGLTLKQLERQNHLNSRLPLSIVKHDKYSAPGVSFIFTCFQLSLMKQFQSYTKVDNSISIQVSPHPALTMMMSVMTDHISSNLPPMTLIQKHFREF